VAIETPIDPASPRSRRAILAAAGGGLAALAAGALAGASPVQAANGDAVTVGGIFTGTVPTIITNTTNGKNVFEADSTSGPCLVGVSSSSFGVYGQSDSATGVVGQSIGVGTGVFGYSSLINTPTAPGDTGVYGLGDHDSAAKGVWGKSPAGQGVRGEATTGIGVYALAPLTGVALLATGKVSFSRSGRATMAAGTSSKTISLAGVSTGSLIFAVIGSNQSGRWVRAVVPASGSFTIYLNTTVLSSTYVSWFVLN
jgi:hypothetical protein